MTKITPGSFEPLRALMVLSVVYGIVFANVCGQQPSPSPLSAAQPATAKIKLNGEDVGTTEDTSVLVRRFTEILDHRSTRFSNGTVFIRAENSTRFSEVGRVIEALDSNHGRPYLAVEVDPARHKKASGDPWITRDYDPLNYDRVFSSSFPRSMMLVVTVGNLDSTRGELISGGIYLFRSHFTLQASARHSVPREFVVVEVFRDNKYVIGDRPIPLSALRSELQARLSRNKDKRIMILTRSDSEIRWGSFMEVVKAAREAGSDMIHILTLTP